MSGEFSVPYLNLVQPACRFVPLPVEFFQHHLNNRLCDGAFRELVGIRKKIAFNGSLFFQKPR